MARLSGDRISESAQRAEWALRPKGRRRVVEANEHCSARAPTMRRFLLEGGRRGGGGGDAGEDKCRGEYSSMSRRPQMKTSLGPHLELHLTGVAAGSLDRVLPV
ncbi:hypothetical protein DMN91_011958 [Ooceraea biroi]|uniref:Uncharacterized protein n=1 Tax=Ooceraea biroi TaxID=2015173 RepID=A0A3L8D8E6_OOCBI|nr:hypothetical protein DMN91_011958 [Ooceraea biroi]